MQGGELLHLCAQGKAGLQKERTLRSERYQTQKYTHGWRRKRLASLWTHLPPLAVPREDEDGTKKQALVIRIV